MSETLLRVGHGILLVEPAANGSVPRKEVLAAADRKWSTFRSAARELGAYQGSPGLAFFDASEEGRLAFGAGAGLAVGVSVGAETVRAVMVDANGWEYYSCESDRLPGQLDAEPTVVLRRIRQTVAKVIDAALSGDDLALVDGALPMLGCSVAWPTPMDRESKPVGHSLAHNSWRSGQRLDNRVSVELGIEGFRSYALNDAHAAAIAVAHHETHRREGLLWKHPMVTIVLRLAGHVGGAVIVLEPPKQHHSGFRKSGFLGSILVGGVDNQAGAIGHVPVASASVGELNRSRPQNLAKLTPQRCACDGSKRMHLEAFVSVLAVTKRVRPKGERGAVLQEIVEHPEAEPQKRALQDVGHLVGDTLVGAVRLLNPAKVIVTGSLGLSVVSKEIKARIEDGHSLGTVPTVGTMLERRDDDFLRARGAALALIRNEVHRSMDKLMAGNRTDVAERVEALTIKLKSNPLSPD